MANRRKFIAALAGVVASAPFVDAAAQTARVYRIGWLDLLGPRKLTGFPQGMRELGWVEGQSFVFEYRFADNQPDRLPALAEELVQRKVDVIVTSSTLSAIAAKKVTSVIPIVASGMTFPVERGLAQSLAHPGWNVTGMTTNVGAGFHPKMVQMLKEAAPRISRLAVLWSPGERFVMEEIDASASALGVTVIDAGAADPAGVPLALAAAVKAGADGLFSNPSGLNFSQRTVIADFALANRLPAVSGHTVFVEAGGLMSYWADFQEIARQSAGYVDKILKGAKPGDLAIGQPTKLELWINLKTAKVLGLAIPQSLLLSADKLIQ